MKLTELQKLPKIELHLHLDCSISFNAAREIKPEITKPEYTNTFIAPEKCIDLADFLSCTFSGIDIMQTENELRIVVDDLFLQLQQENVIYAEIRFAPLLHCQKGMQPEQVTETVSAVFEENFKKTGIKAGLILCTLRHFSEQQSIDTIKLVEKYIMDTPVAGFDLAADEAGFSIDAHKKAFQYAIQKDIPRTAHAGEAKGAHSVRETLQYFKTSRIGHGVRSIEDESLIEHLVHHSTHLEVCPTCNIQTNVFNNFSDHPVDYLFNSGVSIGINTDARTLSNISLSQEYLNLINVFDWNTDHLRKCNLNAISAAFISESEKEPLRLIVNQAYQK